MLFDDDLFYFTLSNFRLKGCRDGIGLRNVYNDVADLMNQKCEDASQYLPHGAAFLNLSKEFEEPWRMANSVVKASKSSSAEKKEKAPSRKRKQPGQ